jgi:hypothetical protein
MVNTKSDIFYKSLQKVSQSVEEIKNIIQKYLVEDSCREIAVMSDTGIFVYGYTNYT